MAIRACEGYAVPCMRSTKLLQRKVHDIMLESELLYVPQCLYFYMCLHVNMQNWNELILTTYCKILLLHFYAGIFEDAQWINPQRIECLVLQHVLYDVSFSSYDDTYCSFWCINSTSSVIHHGKSRKLRKWDTGVSQCEGVWWSLLYAYALDEFLLALFFRWCAMRK